MSGLPLGLKADCIYVQDPLFVALVKNLESEKLEQIVQRLIEKKGFTRQKALEARLAFLRFVSLSQISERSISPIPLADEFWHEFILFTRDYFTFCAKHFGRYIHHQPNTQSRATQLTPKMPVTKSNSESSLEFTINLLGICYGDISKLRQKYLK